MRKLLAAAALILCLGASPVLAGGYEGTLEYYTLTSPDGSELPMYERMDISSGVIDRIPSGTAVHVLRGEPAGWMLIEYNGRKGCVTDGGVVILCTGVRVAEE